jgi:ribosomal protein L31E
MKQRKPLNVGDKVKYFGHAVLWYCDNQWTLQASNDYCEVISLMDKDYISILVNGTNRGIHRRQVYAVKRKKKAVKVISDERFFVVKRKKPECLVIRNTLREAEFLRNTCDFDEILELGIVARHKVNAETKTGKE